MPLTIRLLWLGGPCALILASLMLSTGSERKVVLPFGEIALPELCMMYSRFGIDCPGCGLTRSFIHMSAGRFIEALQVNAIGCLGYLFVVMQIPIAMLQFLPNEKLQMWKHFPLLQKCHWLNQWLFVALMIAMAIQWVVRMLWRISF